MNFKRTISQSPARNTVLKGLGAIGHFPEYYILGVEKCGTSTLYEYIIQHPKINPGRTKESFYFDKNFDQSENWYKGFFPKKDSVDGTPTYYRDIETLRRMPNDKKYVVILREPIARIESAWNMNLIKNWDKRDWKKIWTDECYINFEQGYIHQSKYSERLKDVFHVFGRENVHVMFLEELKINPYLEMDKLFRAWGLDRCKIDEIKPVNPGTYKQHIEQWDLPKLRALFNSENKKLEELLGRGLPY
jgi:hypothetical protein